MDPYNLQKKEHTYDKKPSQKIKLNNESSVK